MNKHLKTLLLVSAIALPVSACSGHLHGKTDDGYYYSGKHCNISRNVERAQRSAENALRELDAASANAHDDATKNRIGKLIKQADKLASDLGQCRRICDAKIDGDAPKKHKKAKAAKAANPAAAAPAAAQPAKAK